MSSQKKLMSAFNFLVLSNYFAFVRSQHCGNNGNFTSNSTYGANLKSLLSSLSTNIGDNGFYNASVGHNPDRVNAVVWCRGDTQLHECRGCIQNATINLIQSCPNQRQAILIGWSCFLRYSDESVMGILATSPQGILYNTRDATSPDQFMADLSTLVNSLRDRASYGDSLRKVATGNISTAGFDQTIFAMLQCSPDLSQRDCIACLTECSRQLPICCYASIGLGVQTPSCFLYYDFKPSYNLTRLQELETVVPAPSAPPIPSPPIPSRPPGNNGNSTITIIVIVVSVVVSLILAIFAGFLLRKRMKQKPKEELDMEEISVVESLQYDFGKIRAATDDFSEANKLGQGGFGAVYKGKLQNGEEIAVKRLSKDSGQGDLEFKNEVMLLKKLQHKNLVRLLGFSLEGKEKLLVYEFVQNASLDNFIFDETKRSQLDWERRYKIIGGIARGMLYLHEGSRVMIIHRDLKASNVLLDGDMNPKIADFGIARLFVPDETHGSTSRIVGTYGYMPPEYAMHGQFSVKSDVFSFGVLILEIISGQKNSSFWNGENVDHLIRSAWENWHEGTTTNLIDPVLIRGTSGIPHDILRCIHIGLLCVQVKSANRPTMASVVLMLNSFSVTMAMPSEPAFLMLSGYDSETSLLQES